MKSYLLVANDFIKTGGMDRANLALADYLAQRGNSVHLVAYQAAQKLMSYPNVTFHRVPKIANSDSLSSPLLNWKGRFQAQMMKKLGGRILVNGGNCDIDDINWVLHVHATDDVYPPRGFLKSLKRRVDYQLALRDERRVIPKARLIFTPCDRVRQDVIQQFGISQNRVHTVYLGIDADRFQPSNLETCRQTRQALGLPMERPLIVFVGALGNRRKGFDTLFQAWQILCQKPEWDANLIVVGRGAEVPTWQQQTISTGLSDRIQFLGFVPELPALLTACNLFVLPSRYESYSLAAQEALCCGTPALISTASGLAERYPPNLAELLLPDPNNAHDLVQRLQHWRDRMDYYREAVVPFSQLLRSGTWDDMAKKMVEIMESFS